MSGFGEAPIKKEGSFISYDQQYVMYPQVIGYQLSLVRNGKWAMKQLMLHGAEVNFSPTSAVTEASLPEQLREALAVLMVLPKEGGYVAGIGARCGDYFYIERGRVE